MYTIVRQFQTGKYTVLELDRPITDRNYTRYEIEGEKYAIVPVYDLPLHIAIEANGNFVGKEINCA